MKKLLRNILLMFLTFGIGVVIFQLVIPKVTLSQLSNNISFYEGKTFEVETYLMSPRIDEYLWTITDFESESSVITVAYFENDLRKPDFLKEPLATDKFKMAKVLIKGKIVSNCMKNCCMKSFTIEPQEVKLLSPVEDYIENK